MSRKTYHWDAASNTLVEGSGPRRVDGPSGDGWRFSDRLYSANPFKAADGTIIDSKRKHREYMKRNNLATTDDFKGTWAKAAQERAKVFEGTHDRNARREAIARAMEK